MTPKRFTVQSDCVILLRVNLHVPADPYCVVKPACWQRRYFTSSSIFEQRRHSTSSVLRYKFSSRTLYIALSDTLVRGTQIYKQYYYQGCHRNKQCFGSGIRMFLTTWIRIRIRKKYADPGSRIQGYQIDQNRRKSFIENLDYLV